MFVSNIQALLIEQCTEGLNKKNNTKYKYKINKSLAYGVLKNRIIELLVKPDKSKIMEELKELYLKNIIPIRPNRTVNRNTDKYRRRNKPKVVKNHKDSY